MNYLRLMRAVIAVLFVLLPGVAGLMKVMGQGSVPEGALPGFFSVSENTFVHFSQGNLQYIGSAGNGDENNSGAYWKFAENQWDYFGENGQGSDLKTVDRDLFGWGTSGWNNGNVYYQPWSTDYVDDYNQGYGYGPTDGTNYTYNLTDVCANADWGYNAIINGGNQENSGWRTLTSNEWEYLFNTRNTPSGIRYAMANVNGVNGVILLPDEWSVSYYSLSNTNMGNTSFGTNTISASQWVTLEQHGAVFLPAACYRLGSSIHFFGYGFYWSTSYYSNGSATGVFFGYGDLYTDSGNYRYYGLSVRLVRPAQNYSYSINAAPNPAEGGMVSGAGTYPASAECTLTAAASVGYTFINWTENGEEVSTEATYSFTVTGDRELVANFIEKADNGVLIYDPFEDYTVGNKIAAEAIAAGHGWWTTWSNAPGSGEDGVIADYGGTQCGHLTYGNDLVLLLGDEESGKYDLEFDILVPEGKNGYFNILHHFAGSNSTWAMQCFLHLTNNGSYSTSAPGHGTVHAGSNATADVPCVYNEWMHFRLNVDTDTDVARYYYTAPGQEEVLVCEWQWSLDSFGASTVGRTLSAMDFFPSENSATSEYYLDNFSFKRIGGASASAFNITPNTVAETLGEDVVSSVNITLNNEGNSIGEWVGWVDFGQGGDGTQSAELAYHNGESGSNIGSTTEFTREMAIRLPITTYGVTATGMKITSVDYYINSSYKSADDHYTFRIYGHGLNNQPGVLLAEQTIVSSELDKWITATFDEAVYLTGQTIWVTVGLQQSADEYPMSMDGGDYDKESDGNWLKTNGGLFDHCYTPEGGISGAWMITVHCEGELVPAAWASINKSDGSLSGGQSDVITLTLNPTCLAHGTYNANLIINTNDENMSHVEIPVTLYYGLDYTVNATPYPAEGGTVSGAGTYPASGECTLTATASAGYIFVNWTENGEVVSTDPTYLFTVTGDRELVANFVSAGSNVTDGALNGVFSVGDNSTVQFSQGNLQYIGSAGNGDENNSGAYWKFAEHQWDYLGDNGQGSDSKTVDRDLFGWGTSGYNHGANCYQPWSTNYYDYNYYTYGSDTYNLHDQTGMADWGYNAISNGGNQENCGWRTLTHDEWDYVFNTRNTASGIRYAKATVNGVNGVILLPDDWTNSYYELSNTNTSGASFSSNTISSTQWMTLEQHGAVFLPAAGIRSGTSVYNVGSFGNYWSASYVNSYGAYSVDFDDGNLSSYDDSRFYGHSVRLVCPVENYSIHATPNPAEGGAVSGAGAYAEGAECTLTATASVGYTFVNWTENGEVVSTDPTYLFTVTGYRELVANFVSAGSNVTDGALNGVFSVGENTTVRFSQGNLQYKASTNTWRFAESQWDYVGTQTPVWGDPGGTVPQSDNSNISQNYSGWIDLFGWGTSGWNNGNVYYQPWSTDDVYDWSTGFGYGPTDGSNYEYGLTGAYANADWGSNAISNGGNQENSGWRTLTQPEWDYVFNTRTMVNGGPRYTLGRRVEGVLGVVVYPDNYAESAVSSDLTAEGWAEYEAAGCVFLPAAGYRHGTSVYYVGSYGDYWSASCDSTYGAWSVYFRDSYLYTGSNSSRNVGHSVRLVRSAQNYSFTIHATPNPAEGGAVSGAGAYAEGAECTLTATASAGYIFVNWTENGEVVSTDPTYLFTVTGDRELVANFSAAVDAVQDIHLSEGWNWFSSYITYDENSFGYMTEAIGDMVTTSVIKSQTEFTSLDVSGWSGTLDDLQNQNMYMILVGGDIDISLNGALVNPAAVPITLSSGWNWMVYLPNVTMSLEQGLANLEPVDGDMIKSQSGFSSYNSDEGGWVGTLNLLKPGEGYAYLNNGMEDKTLVYPNSSKSAVEENTEKRHFSYNCHRFMSNMTLMITLDASEFDLGKGSHEIAAFVGDDCRGSARLQEVNGQYIAFVTVGGEDGEEVTFRLFDVKGGEVYPEVAQEKLRYATDAVYGSLKEPFKLHFKGAGLDETEAMLRVSPNPVYAHGEVRLGLPTAEKVRVEIYSALGVKVMSKETSDGRVVLSPAVVPGTYIMKVVSASGAGHYCKLIVE